MKKLFTLLMLVGLALGLKAQQTTHYSWYWKNAVEYNAGSAGMCRKTLCATSMFREQWLGFKGTNEGYQVDVPQGSSPTTYNILLSSYLPKPFRGGLSLAIVRDELGFEKNTNVTLGYAYHMYLGNGILGIGVQGLLKNKILDYSQYVPIDANDPLLISSSEENAMGIDANLGVFYQTSDWYAGFSTTSLIGLSQKFAIGDYQQKRHFYFVGGYNYPINSSLTLETHGIIKTDLGSFGAELTAMANMGKVFKFGMSYRFVDAMSLLFEYIPNGDCNGLSLGMAYDVPTSRMGYGNSMFGSVEMYLRYCFDVVIIPDPVIHWDPRDPGLM